MWLDEQVFADGKVNLIGQVIGLIVADSAPLAQRAAKLVKVTYEDLPSIITIEVGHRVLLENFVIFWHETFFIYSKTVKEPTSVLMYFFPPSLTHRMQ